jgi:hypothetical protein
MYLIAIRETTFPDGGDSGNQYQCGHGDDVDYSQTQRFLVEEQGHTAPIPSSLFHSVV